MPRSPGAAVALPPARRDLPAPGLGPGPESSCPAPEAAPVMSSSPEPCLPAPLCSLGTGKYLREPHPHPTSPRPGPGALAFLSIRPSSGQEQGGWPRPLTAGSETGGPPHSREDSPHSSHLSGMQSLPEREEAGQPPLRPRGDTGNHRPGLLESPTGVGCSLRWPRLTPTLGIPL